MFNLKFNRMKNLSIEKMEKIEGGDLFSFLECIGILQTNGIPWDYAGAICFTAEMYPVTT